jgi:hypothetical protein
MKNTFKLFGIIALIAVVGFSMAACGGDDDGGADPFEGTWVNTAQGLRIVAADKSAKVYLNNAEIIRCTYTVSGNSATAKITEVNPSALGFPGGSSWVKYSELDSATKTVLTQQGMTETATATINGSTCTFFGVTYTKQQ